MIRRGFIAIEVPAAVREALAVATASLCTPTAGLRPTTPTGWHLTLAFLGDLDDAGQGLAVDVVDEVLSRHAPRPAPWLELGAPGRFGDRVLYVAVDEDPPGALSALAEALRAELEAVGFALPGAGFRPHVTLARARRKRRVQRADVAALAVPAQRWQPTSLGLWAGSVPGSPRPYEVLAEVAWPSGPPPGSG